MSKQPLWTPTFLFICFSAFTLFMIFNLFIPTLPLYALTVLSVSETQIGLIMASFIAASVIARLFAGLIIDRFGEKRVLLTSFFVVFISAVLHIWSLSFEWLLFLRFLQGLGFGVATTAAGALAIVLSPANRQGEAVGYYSMFMSLAMVIGPVVGLQVVEHGSFTWLFILTVGLSGIGFLLATLIVFKANRKPPEPLSINRFIAPNAMSVSFISAIASFAYGGILSFITLYATSLQLESAASLFFIVYAIVLLISRFFTGRLFDRFGENAVLYPTLLLFACGLFLLSQATSLVAFLIAAIFMGAGFGSVLPSFQTLAVQSVTRSQAVQATSTFYILYDLGIGVGSFTLGFLVTGTSYSFMYFVSAFVVLLAVVAYRLLHHRKLKKLQVRRMADTQ
ncbi:MFS family permease [Alkalihalobacillus xiaoxiensis]|uniref:MFS family permease n=1 Tax=Shouchella xiaoxiensis TaxID=766895 RepID=A0ABS2SSG1_9BACI|nr:MFS transporter [Shouchella xiaoxiensis]MBM7838444.1 MFS family permease [Shouchella xiaoxiensis]